MGMAHYPNDYPLWQDINFTPDWVYQRLQKRKEYQPSWLPPRFQEAPVIATPDKAWNEDEDALVIFAQSQEGKEDGLNYKNVAAALGRSLTSQWSGEEVDCRTVGAVKSRWFRELKPWRETEPSLIVEQKIEEGRRLAFERYK